MVRVVAFKGELYRNITAANAPSQAIVSVLVCTALVQDLLTRRYGGGFSGYLRPYSLRCAVGVKRNAASTKAIFGSSNEPSISLSRTVVHIDINMRAGGHCGLGQIQLDNSFCTIKV